MPDYLVRPHRDPAGRVQFLAMIEEGEVVDPAQLITITTDADLGAPVGAPPVLVPGAAELPAEYVDRRVLFQYIDDQGSPHFEFLTSLAHSDDDAIENTRGQHAADVGFSVVQVVASNGVPTGFDAADRSAAVAEYAARVNEHGERRD